MMKMFDGCSLCHIKSCPSIRDNHVCSKCSNSCNRYMKQPAGSHRSTNMVGESGRVVSRSVMAFHSLMQLCSEVMQLS